MKLPIYIFWVGVAACLISAPTFGQEKLPSMPLPSIMELSAGDTLPTIEMKAEPILIVLSVLSGAYPLMSWHSYEINDHKNFSPIAMKPYFRATGDEQLEKFYHNHTVGRIVWYTTTVAGSVLLFQAFIYVLSFDPSLYKAANNLGIAGIGLGLVGLAARIICFRNLRNAVNLYNFNYAGKIPKASLQLGLSSYTPTGLGVRLKF